MKLHRIVTPRASPAVDCNSPNHVSRGICHARPLVSLCVSVEILVRPSEFERSVDVVRLLCAHQPSSLLISVGWVSWLVTPYEL